MTHSDFDLAERGGAAEVTDRRRRLDEIRATAGDLPLRASDPRARPPCAPELGAPPSYLEVGLWKDRTPAVTDGAELMLNPALRIAGDAVVVPDPVTGIDALFAADEPMLDLLARIAAEPAEIDRLPDPLNERLAALGILIDARGGTAAKAEWERTIREAARSFRDGGYAELPRLHCPAIIAFLRQRYRRMARDAALPQGDPQCPTRWIAHNEEAALPLHAALVPVVSAVVGEPVKASYLYLGAYAAGSTLPKHTDREQCEFTVSMLIDYLPDIAGPSSWPLLVYVDDEPLPIHQHLGQALLFGGRKLAHSRPALPEGHMSTSIFFHFVRKDFRGRID